MSTAVPIIVHVTDHPGFWHLDLTTIIGAFALLFAWRAARWAATTVRDTREMRWEANLNRVLEALIAIESAAYDIEPATQDRSRTPWQLESAMRYAQQELRRALVFPRVVTDNDEANDLLEQLRSRDDLGGEPERSREWARKAGELLSTQPPGETWPRWVLLTMTFIPRHRATLREWWSRR